MTITNITRRVGAVLFALVLLAAGCGSSDSTPTVAADAGEVAAVETEAVDETSDLAQEVSANTEEATTENQESHVDADDLEYHEADIISIALNGTTASADSSSVDIEGSTVTITTEGTYSLSGTLTDGDVIVDAGDSDDVLLILDEADITNSDGAAIAFMKADEATVVLADGTTNRLADGATYTFPDAETDEPNATLFSTADLTLGGSGELIVEANYNDGITSKDGLAIESGTITVHAVDDGIRGKDYVIVNSATVTIHADGDGIKADNEDDADRGYVLVASGSVNITAGDDGIQATTDVLVTSGELTIEAAGRGVQGDVMVVISGGAIDARAGDDAIHSNDAVVIDDGTLTIAAGDDGIHGDYSVTINNGAITITEAYEGIESEVITINDGFIDLTSSDDGINVADADTVTVTEPDAADTTAGAVGRPAGPGGGRGGPEEAVGEHYVYINGGTIAITITGDLNEQGDGIDANGHVVMTGGLVTVSGPTDTRNSALDYSGGTFEMTGGTFIGTNVDGRNSEGIGVGSSQASLYVTTGTIVKAGSVVHIETPDGQNVITFEPANDYSVIVFSSPDLVVGQDYDVYLGGSVAGTVTAAV
jgi:hypothetical protein